MAAPTRSHRAAGRCRPIAAALTLAEGCAPALAAAGCALALGACGSSIAATSTSADIATAIRFTHCMRAHGVTNFPDPQPGGGFPRGSGLEQSSPAFGTARKACQGILGAGVARPAPTAAEKAAALKFSRCMRGHGVPGFHDPVPRAQDRGGTGLVDGGIVFPLGPSIDINSPAFQHASSVCGGSGPAGAAKGG